MTYRSVVVTRTGPPEVLQVVENAVREPSKGEARIKVLAAAVSWTDITVRTGHLLPNGKSFKLYGTSSYFLGQRKPYLEDWATLFKLLEERKIAPVIMQKFPIVEADRANELLESGHVVGNVVLVAPDVAK